MVGILESLVSSNKSEKNGIHFCLNPCLLSWNLKVKKDLKLKLKFIFRYFHKKATYKKNQYWNLFVHNDTVRYGLRYNVIAYASDSCYNQGIHVPTFVTRISGIQHLVEIMIFETNGRIFNLALPKAFSRFRMVTR